MDVLRIALAQINGCVGDLSGNKLKILDGITAARDAGAHIVAFPELAVPGYPPEDLLLKPQFVADNIAVLREIAPAAEGICAIVGFADCDEDVYNAAAVIWDGRIAGVYRKQLLPNYGVFDEARYFRRGSANRLFGIGGVDLGVTVCEDIWYPDGPAEKQAAAGAEVLINISASPYHMGKGSEREEMIATRARDYVAYMVYCNLVGGQDELVFDGHSVVFGPEGELIARARQFHEDFLSPISMCRPSPGRDSATPATVRTRSIAISNASTSPTLSPRPLRPPNRRFTSS
jgi:NAD+ synthase (glutamine-hydrolysing)